MGSYTAAQRKAAQRAADAILTTGIAGGAVLIGAEALDDAAKMKEQELEISGEDSDN
jgi:hypothetical protein